MIESIPYLECGDILRYAISCDYDTIEAAANVSVLIIVYYVFAMFASVFVAESMQTHHIGGDSK
jgi:hypothetical protein